jgi:hypothetical protein
MTVSQCTPMMADNVQTSSSEVAAQAVNVRAELKTWEKAFALDNGGRKAGRNDIKQNVEIGRSNLMLHEPAMAQ